MVVTLCTGNRHSHKSARNRLDGGKRKVLILIFRRDRTARQKSERERIFRIRLYPHALPGSGHFCVFFGPVSQNLRSDEVVVGHVMVQRRNSPVPPQVDAGGRRHHRPVQAIEVRITEHVQPMPGPAYPVLLIA